VVLWVITTTRGDEEYEAFSSGFGEVEKTTLVPLVGRGSFEGFLLILTR
jgi:hypothetical protein